MVELTGCEVAKPREQRRHELDTDGEPQESADVRKPAGLGDHHEDGTDRWLAPSNLQADRSPSCRSHRTRGPRVNRTDINGVVA